MLFRSSDIIKNNNNNDYDIKINNYEKMFPLTYHEVIQKKNGEYIIL